MRKPTFLMYRVELKVPEKIVRGEILRKFLMYRVELKAHHFWKDDLLNQPFLMYRVELKEKAKAWFGLSLLKRS